jgi:hypothetical protein
MYCLVQCPFIYRKHGVNSSHFNQLNTAKQKPRHCVENLDTGFGYDIKMAGIKPLNEISTAFSDISSTLFKH